MNAPTFTLGQPVTYTAVLTRRRDRNLGPNDPIITELAEPVRGIVTGRRTVELPDGKRGYVWLVTSNLTRAPHRVLAEHITIGEQG